jgi:hypothetical protein
VYGGTDYITLNWDSNLTSCQWFSTPALGSDVGIQTLYHSPYFPEDSATIAPNGPGTYTVTVACSGDPVQLPLVTSEPITVTVLPTPDPTATLTASPSDDPAGQPLTLTWSSTNASGCTMLGFTPNEGSPWLAGTSIPASGSVVIHPDGSGPYELGVSCQSGLNSGLSTTATTLITITAPLQPSVTLSASPTTVDAGQSVTLSWTSKNASSCTASGSWSDSLGTSGTSVQHPTATSTYGITCGTFAGLPTTSAMATVTVSAPASAQPSGTGSGGGAVGEWELIALTALLWLRSVSDVKHHQDPAA